MGTATKRQQNGGEHGAWIRTRNACTRDHRQAHRRRTHTSSHTRSSRCSSSIVNWSAHSPQSAFLRRQRAVTRTRQVHTSRAPGRYAACRLRLLEPTRGAARTGFASQCQPWRVPSAAAAAPAMAAERRATDARRRQTPRAPTRPAGAKEKSLAPRPAGPAPARPAASPGNVAATTCVGAVSVAALPAPPGGGPGTGVQPGPVHPSLALCSLAAEGESKFQFLASDILRVHNRDYARRARLGYRDGSPGPPKRAPRPESSG